MSGKTALCICEQIVWVVLTPLISPSTDCSADFPTTSTAYLARVAGEGGWVVWKGDRCTENFCAIFFIYAGGVVEVGGTRLSLLRIPVGCQFWVLPLIGVVPLQVGVRSLPRKAHTNLGGGLHCEGLLTPLQRIYFSKSLNSSIYSCGIFFKALLYINLCNLKRPFEPKKAITVIF